MPARVIRIVLDERDFQTLVSGGILKKPRANELTESVIQALQIQIILSDIGYQRMFHLIAAAAVERDEPHFPL